MPGKTKETAQEPLVSFLLPVYNAGEFLEETLNSILEQSYKNFEVIAINDGSKDGSLEVLQRYAKIDNRIHVYDQPNQRLVATLNRAISLAKGTYLARIDSDDLCVPHRIRWQVEAMEKDPDAALCYGFFEIFSEEGEFLSKEIRPSHQEDIKRMMYFRNPIAHASVMMRRSMLPDDWYSPDVGPTEDYELWSRLARHDFVCVPKVIMRYRVTNNSIMHVEGHKQHEHMRRNTDKYWEYMGPPALRSRAEIRANMIDYMQEYRESWVGPATLSMFLDTDVQLAMKCFKKGMRSYGMRMFFNTMFSSRTGFRVCRRRLTGLVSFRFKKLLGKAT